MSCSILRERLLPLADVCKLLPNRPHRSTVERWRLRGVRGVRLETWLVGGCRYTSYEALDRFFAATTASADGPPCSGRSTPGRNAWPADSGPQDAEASRILDDAGISGPPAKEEDR
ncbi:DUF1580 domain-containing protein [Botrimarina sp.]|uniref:DUF1580 domain-containing protein n=1 Tax=Botrimarina sp. TaxID=2795802 RepID=UPI0032EDC499